MIKFRPLISFRKNFTDYICMYPSQYVALLYSYCIPWFPRYFLSSDPYDRISTILICRIIIKNYVDTILAFFNQQGEIRYCAFQDCHDWYILASKVTNFINSWCKIFNKKYLINFCLCSPNRCTSAFIDEINF